MALAGVTLMGIAVASTPGHPADVTFIPLSVPHKILSNVSIATAATNSTVVNGGSTTVPTDATSVQLRVAVKSAAAGSLSVFPRDHPGSMSADTISFAAGNVLTTRVTRQSPGLSSEVSFKNNGPAGAVVTVTITGYSTQTTASNISGSGGTAGDVLTNTGAGASWQAAGINGYKIVSSTPVSVTAGSAQVASAACPPGSVVLGGGASSDNTAESLISSWPDSSSSWSVAVRNESTITAHGFTVYAICAHA
jgi:hypothetical protein